MNITLSTIKLMLKKGSKLIVLATIILSFSSGFAQTRYYVNQSVAASGNGSSWAAAFKTLQEGINAASSTVADEIWVAKGTYYPDTDVYGTHYTPPSSSKYMSFYLKKPIKLYGGFTGNETTLSQRDPEINETILSGNINNPADSTDNLYHVVLIAGTENNPLQGVMVDGFTISDGYANFQGSNTVDGNEVFHYNGGGIYTIYAAPELHNLKIFKNVGFVGGGIHISRSDPQIDNCKLLGNYGIAQGGGIYNLESTTLISNSLLEGNFVNNEKGGGIDNHNSNVTIRNTTIRNNKAPDGGGIANLGKKMILENVILEGNKANTRGGAIYNFTGTDLSLNNVTIQNNRAGYGGGINSFRSLLQIDNSSIKHNIAENVGGGGIYLNRDTLYMNDTHLDSNKSNSQSGGGLYSKDVFINIARGTVTGNTARSYGGGLFISNKSYGTISKVEIIKNSCALEHGGGLYIENTSSAPDPFQINQVTFMRNTAKRDGGGMCITGTSPIINGSKFIENVSNTGGGLAISTNSNPEITNCLFEKNNALTGAGINSHSTAVPIINSSSFLQNEADGNGGGIHFSGIGYVNAPVIQGNKASYGGGIYLNNSVNITNALITGNYVTQRGGAVYIFNASPVFTNATISGNWAGTGGGGMYLDYNSVAHIRNTIIHGNNTGLTLAGGTAQLSYSFVEGLMDDSNGNIPGNVDPLFVDPKSHSDAPFISGNYLLQPTSPLLDKGDNSFYAAGGAPDLSGITGDVNGNPRFYNTLIDIGAYEYSPGAMPLKLISFLATFKGNTVELYWQTADEVNVSHFEIERSTDAVYFTEVGRRGADGKGIYQFTDTRLPEGIIYYRLKMVDKDGYTEYSPVRLVKNSDLKTTNLMVYPNPSSNVIYIVDKDKKLLEGLFTIRNASGRMVGQSYSNPVKISSLTPGMYYITITGKDGKMIGAQSVIKK